MRDNNSIPHWQSDGAGSRARIGVLTPHFDPVPESELWAMAPPGVSIHASRVLYNHDARSFAQPPHVDMATELLAGLAPHVIVYAYTGSSYVLGAAADDALLARLAPRAPGIPIVLPAPAAAEALRLLQVHRLALIHPPWFSDAMNAAGNDYFASGGFDVVYCARMTPARRFTEVAPAEVYAWTTANVPREAEGVFIGGNGLRAIGAIEALEDTLGRAVLTANQVAFWQALRGVEMTSAVRHYGRIFTERAAQQGA